MRDMADLKSIFPLMFGASISLLVFAFVICETSVLTNGLIGVLIWPSAFLFILFLSSILLAMGIAKKVIPWIMIVINVFIMFLCLFALWLYMHAGMRPPNVVTMLPTSALLSAVPIMYTLSILHFFKEKRLLNMFLFIILIYVIITGLLGWFYE